jgi:PIN domain nuclease of toxin-antitoxin system
MNAMASERRNKRMTVREETIFKRAAANAIETAAEKRRLFVSAASVWEIALKQQKGDVLVSGDLRAWLREQRR